MDVCREREIEKERMGMVVLPRLSPWHYYDECNLGMLSNGMTECNILCVCEKEGPRPWALSAAAWGERDLDSQFYPLGSFRFPLWPMDIAGFLPSWLLPSVASRPGAWFLWLHRSLFANYSHMEALLQILDSEDPRLVWGWQSWNAFAPLLLDRSVRLQDWSHKTVCSVFHFHIPFPRQSRPAMPTSRERELLI